MTLKSLTSPVVGELSRLVIAPVEVTGPVETNPCWFAEIVISHKVSVSFTVTACGTCVLKLPNAPWLKLLKVNLPKKVQKYYMAGLLIVRTSAT